MKKESIIILVLLVVLITILGFFTLDSKKGDPANVPSIALPELPTPPTPTSVPNETTPTSGTRSKTIPTDAGDLILTFKDGTATLEGTLARSTPCVEWNIDVTSTKDLPPSSIHFSVTKKSTAEICIQVLGEPQKIRATTPAGPDTEYTVRFEEDMTLFTGKL